MEVALGFDRVHRVRRSHFVNIALALLAVLLVYIVGRATGQIEVERGRGFDGTDYANMLEEGWRRGTVNTALRPLVVEMNRPAYALLGQDVAAFRAMNYVYAGLLGLGLCLLAGQYGASTPIKALIVANVFLTIAAAKYFTYYPVLIDAGAYAIQTLAIYFIVARQRLATALSCVAAALSREFGIAVVLFGVCRDLRLRVPLWRTAVTYAPAVIIYFAWRAVVQSELANRGSLVTISALANNLDAWRDPMFVGLFGYFLATCAGGLTLLVLARADLAWRVLRVELEWAAFAVVILAAAAMGSSDMWRYQAYLLPFVVVVFVLAMQQLPSRGWQLAVAAIVCAVTIVTQRPFQQMTLATYFRDWFPYYVHLDRVPREIERLSLWPVWGWRLMAAIMSVWLLVTCLPAEATTSDANRT
jgi:hypothetical protein